MSALKIIGLCIFAAVLYGVAHDQVTVWVCAEYFTFGLPKIVATESPPVLGFVWGVIATWWVGLLLGVPLAFAACHGPLAPRTTCSLVRPIAMLLICMASAALVSGLVTYAFASQGMVFPLLPPSKRMPTEQLATFLSINLAHATSYAVGLVGGILLIRKVWKQRKAKGIDLPVIDLSQA